MNNSKLNEFFLLGVQLYRISPVKFCRSKPIFCCTLVPNETTVVGNMYLGIIFSVLNGKKKRGKFNLISVPISEILKNWSSESATSLEAPKVPRAEISKVSAPRNTFLLIKDVLNEKP